MPPSKTSIKRYVNIISKTSKSVEEARAKLDRFIKQQPLYIPPSLEDIMSQINEAREQMTRSGI